jgi:hypothetical protein
MKMTNSHLLSSRKEHFNRCDDEDQLPPEKTHRQTCSTTMPILTVQIVASNSATLVFYFFAANLASIAVLFLFRLSFAATLASIAVFFSLLSLSGLSFCSGLL